MAGGAGNDGKQGDGRMSGVMIVILVGAVAALIFGGIPLLSYLYSLNIRSRTVGDGQHGTARWATKREIGEMYLHVPFEPEQWRLGQNLPTEQGIVVGCEGRGDGLPLPSRAEQQGRHLLPVHSDRFSRHGSVRSHRQARHPRPHRRRLAAKRTPSPKKRGKEQQSVSAEALKTGEY